MARLSRTKGRAFERAIAAKLRPLFGARIKRGYQARDGRAAPDVDGSPFWIECKHGKAVSVRAALAQGMAATDGRPVVVVAKDHGARDAIVCMRLTDWLELVDLVLPESVVRALKGDEHETGQEGASHGPAADQAGGKEGA